MAKQQSNTQVGIFVLNNSAEYPWTVYVYVPNPKGGNKIKQKLKVRFKHLDKVERNAILETFKERLKAAQKAGDNPQSEDDVDSVKELMSFQRDLLMQALTWFECIDPEGKPVDPSDDNKADLLNNLWAEDAIMHGYAQSLRGRSDEGN